MRTRTGPTGEQSGRPRSGSRAGRHSVPHGSDPSRDRFVDREHDTRRGVVRGRRRRRRTRAGLGAVALLSVVTVVFGPTGILSGRLALAPGAETSATASDTVEGRLGQVAAVPSGGVSVEAIRATDRLLEARTAALVAGDRAAWAATIADPTSVDGKQLLTEFDVLTALDVKDLEYESARGLPMPADADPGGAVAVAAEVRYVISGFDTAAAKATEQLVVTDTGEGWRIRAALDEPSSEPAPIWSLPAAHVVRSAHAVVAGDVSRQTLSAYVAMADTAVAQVNAVWHRAWPERLVVLVPGDAHSLQMLAGSADDFTQVGGLTSGHLSRDGRARADRILLNPDALSQLTSRGRQFVLSHEASHVAVRASHPGRSPMWFSEGLADYIAYRPIKPDAKAVSPELMDRVRDGQWPRRLPVDSDFTSPSARLAPTYAASWFAVDEIVRRHGEQKMLGLYAACTAPLGESGSLPEESEVEQVCAKAFPGVLGTTQAEFTGRWYARMRHVAGNELSPRAG